MRGPRGPRGGATPAGLALGACAAVLTRCCPLTCTTPFLYPAYEQLCDLQQNTDLSRGASTIRKQWQVHTRRTATRALRAWGTACPIFPTACWNPSVTSLHLMHRLLCCCAGRAVRPGPTRVGVSRLHAGMAAAFSGAAAGRPQPAYQPSRKEFAVCAAAGRDAEAGWAELGRSEEHPWLQRRCQSPPAAYSAGFRPSCWYPYFPPLHNHHSIQCPRSQ